MKKLHLSPIINSKTKENHQNTSTSGIVGKNILNNSNNSHEHDKLIIPVTSTLSRRPKSAVKNRQIRHKPRDHQNFSYTVKRKKQWHFQRKYTKRVSMSCIAASCRTLRQLRKAVAMETILFHLLSEISLILDVEDEIHSIVIASPSTIKCEDLNTSNRREQVLYSMLEWMGRVIKVYFSIIEKVLDLMRLNIDREQAGGVRTAPGA